MGHGEAGLMFPFLARGFLSAAILRAIAGIGLAGTGKEDAPPGQTCLLESACALDDRGLLRPQLGAVWDASLGCTVSGCNIRSSWRDGGGSERPGGHTRLGDPPGGGDGKRGGRLGLGSVGTGAGHRDFTACQCRVLLHHSCFGFLAAALSPTAVGLVLDRLQSASGGTAAISPWQWGPAFGILALGVLMGPFSMLALRRAQAQRHRQPPRSEESV